MNKLIVSCLLFSPLLYAETSLSLSDCIQASRKESAQVKQANQELDAAKEKKAQARTHWFPTVSAQATVLKSYDYLIQMDNAGGNLPVYDGNPANLATATQYAYMPASSVGLIDQMGVAMVSVVQPVYAGGRVSNSNKLAELGVDVARIQRERTEKDAVLSTIDRYQGLIALHAKRQTLAAQLGLMDTLSREVRQAFAVGFATSRDTLDLSHRQHSVQNGLQDLDAGIALAERDLCRSLDMTCSGSLRLTDSLGPIVSPEVIRIDHDVAMGNREECRLLDKSVEAADLQGDLNQGSFKPEVSVGAMFMEMGDFNNSPTTNALVFANVSVPLTGIWEGAHKSQESRANKEKASLDAKETKSLIRLEMDKSWNDLVSAWRGLELARQHLNQERVAMADARINFAQGNQKASDLISAQLDFQSAEESEILARRVYLLKQAYYLKATGRDPGQP